MSRTPPPGTRRLPRGALALLLWAGLCVPAWAGPAPGSPRIGDAPGFPAPAAPPSPLAPPTAPPSSAVPAPPAAVPPPAPGERLPTDLTTPVITDPLKPRAIDPVRSGPQPTEEEKRETQRRCERASYVVRQGNDLKDESSLTVSYYNRALALCPGHPEANFRLGVIATHQKKTDEALKFFGRAVRTDPALVEGHYNLGIINRHLGKPQEARRLFERALEIDPRHALSLYNLGVIQVRALERIEAEKNFRAAAASDPKLAEAHFFLGALLQEQGRRAEARAELQKALRLRPGLALPRVYLAAILESEGNSREAQKELSQALQLNPASVNVNYGYEEFYFREAKAGSEIVTKLVPRRKEEAVASRLPAAPAGAAAPASGAPEKMAAPPAKAPPFGERREARELPVPGGAKAEAKKAPAPAPERAAAPAAPKRTRPAGLRTYRVRAGDTLSRIAARYGTTVAALMEINRDRIEHPSVLDVGQRINVPGGRRPRPRARSGGRKAASAKKAPPKGKAEPKAQRPAAKGVRLYRVRPGDSLSRIARRHGVTVETLLRMNRDRIEHPSVLDVGQIIRVPPPRK